ncbi:uncharacterized protein N7482_004999 [Penicillium canariense]|uniref:Alcohol acetyltransferase n=1 Tax=Penicillium canariense TaxID=189055 RepID=A0A9W9I3Q4_9EURO|nr:uncharacterized protein N7482_004999 [Penicillium canariense]KAJ5166218.1 hypothetical protein N7482_004999 [Penicillium canariense]
MDQYEKLRPVGRLEQYSTARHQIGFYLNVAVTATYLLPDCFTLPIRDYVYRACETAIAEHPALSAIPVADDTQQPYFVRLPQINLDQVVSFEQRKNVNLSGETIDGEPTPDLDLQALLEIQHNTPFTAPNAYWRLCILSDSEDDRRFTAAFVFHHALGDGTSGKVFHQTFLQALHLAEAGETKSVIQAPSKPMLPNIEEIHPMPLSLVYLAKKIFQAKIYSRRDPGLWSGGKIQTQGKTRVRLVPFSKALVTSLRNVCRQEHTTITAILHTAIARSLFTHLPAHFTRLNCTGAISCRRWLPDIITDEVIGVYVGDIEDSYTRADVTPPNNVFPWSEARRSKQTIDAAVQREGRDAGPNLLKYVADYQQELCLSKVGSERDQSFEVSNIGVMQCEARPRKPRIERMVFSQCASVIGNAIEVSVVTGGDGCLVLAITWQVGVVEESLIEAAIVFLVGELRALAGLE